MRLTRRQQEILDFLRDHAQALEHPPTLDELCAMLGLRSRGSLHKHVQVPWPSGTAVPAATTKRQAMNECLQQGFQVLAVRWCEDGPMPGCLLVYCFDSAQVARRVTAAVEDGVVTMASWLANGLIGYNRTYGQRCIE